MCIADLQGDPPRAEKGDDAISLEEIMRGLGHEIRNNLQVIRLGLDLIRLVQVRPLDDRIIVRGTERIYKLLEEVKEYLSPPEFCVSTDNLTMVLEEIVRRTAEKWQREGYLRIINDKPLPLLRLDWRQFHLTLERVLDFAHVLLPPDGQVEVEARMQGSTEQRTIELRAISTGSIPLEVQEQDIFRPFLHVNGHQVGLSLVLAKRTLNSHHGQISFHKETPQQCVLSISLGTY
jgi:nitrogen-specific signal transduction histidine kinase